MKTLKNISAIVIISCLILGLPVSAGEGGNSQLIQNTFHDSQVQQYYFINCGEECEAVFEQMGMFMGQGISAPAETDDEQEEDDLTDMETGEDGFENENSQTEEEPSEDNLSSEEDSNVNEESDNQTVDEIPSDDDPSDEAGNSGAETEISDEESESPPQESEENEQENSVVVGYHDLRINEFMPDPESGADELVEIYNTLETAVDLTGWVVEEGGGKQTDLSGEIVAGGYVVVERKYLNNSGDILFLRDAEGTMIDQVTYGNWDDGIIEDNIPAPKKGNTIILHQGEYKETIISSFGEMNVYTAKQDSSDANQESDNNDQETTDPVDNLQEDEVIENNQEAEEQDGVEDDLSDPEEEIQADEDQQTVNYDYSDEIAISELLPNPEGSDDSEWIELHNTGETTVNLKGWSLDDGEGGSSPFTVEEDLFIEAGQYLIIDRAMSGLALNNSGDAVRLMDPDGVIVSEYTYVTCHEGKSWAWINSEWIETMDITPGAENIVSVQTAEFLDEASDNPEDYDESTYLTVNLQEARNLPLQSKIVTQGQVSVLPGVLGKQIMYVSGSGMQVYFSKALWPELSLGDRISLKGSLSESRGERRILIKETQDIEKISGGELSPPLEISLTQVGEEYEGNLVKVKGEIIEKNGSKLYLLSGSEEAVLKIKKGTEINLASFENGDEIEAVGIVSQYDENYFVLPRRQEDLVNITKQNLPVVGDLAENETIASEPIKLQARWVLAVLAVGLLFVNAIYAYKNREKLFTLLKLKLNSANSD